MTSLELWWLNTTVPTHTPHLRHRKETPMELNDKQEALVMRVMELLRDQLESEKRDDDPQILTDALNENIKILDELISLIENGEFFLELTEC